MHSYFIDLGIKRFSIHIEGLPMITNFYYLFLEWVKLSLSSWIYPPLVHYSNIKCSHQWRKHINFAQFILLHSSRCAFYAYLGSWLLIWFYVFESKTLIYNLIVFLPTVISISDSQWKFFNISNQKISNVCDCI